MGAAPGSRASTGQPLTQGSEKEGKTPIPSPPPTLPSKATGAKATIPDLPLGPHSPHSRPKAASPAASGAQRLWKASSSAHYRNLIWIPRDQEESVESGCHRGSDAEADPKPAKPRHAQGFPGAQAEARQMSQLRALRSWAVSVGEAAARLAEGAGGHTAGRRARDQDSSRGQTSQRPSA